MRRPAFYALVCFTSGIVLGDLFDLPVLLLLSGSALSLVFCLLFHLTNDKIGTGLFLVLSLLVAGFFRYELCTRQFPPDHVTGFLALDSPVTVTGKIAEEPDVRGNKTFIVLEAETISVWGEARSASGRIILKIREPTYGFDYADRIRFKGHLNPPSSKRNPGAFDYRRYLSRRSIFATVTLAHADQIEITGNGRGGFYWSRIIIPLRRWIQGVFCKTMSGDHGALLEGFLLGETRNISTKVYTMFRDTGTVHLLAVSGSNVWLVVGVILAALGLLRVPKIPATLLSLICILIFANLVRNDPPVVRAGIMATVVLLGSLVYRDIDLVNVVSFAGLVILFVSPLFLFDVGFQLSFASVFGILLVYPKLKGLLPSAGGRSRKRLWKWIMVPALISISVELILFPILAYYFNMVPLVVVVANIFVVPLAGLAVVLALFTLFSAPLSVSLAGIFSAANWLCLELTLRLTGFFAGLPAAKISVPAPSTSDFVLYYIFLWTGLSLIGSKRKVFLFLVLIVANIFVWKHTLSSGRELLQITLLDAGKGSATVMRLPNGETVLINAGEKTAAFDAGEYVVIPFLNHSGTTEVDRLIITDTDPQSMNSACSVVKDRKVGSLILPDDDSESPDRIRSKLTQHFGSQITSLDSVQTMGDEKTDLTFRFYAPPIGHELRPTSRPTVVKIAYKDISVCLFDGMKKASFDSQFDWSQFEDCSVLVLPELGDVEEIIQVIAAVKPERIIFTRHYFRYERDKIPLLMQLSFPGIEYYRTAEGGAISCCSRGKEIQIRPTIRSD